ncbi:unnamed protein product [Pleuronectes platessa]|uniref:Uncharacterized protein n=1 Tax=Pleuronectes platessa TaxID=8262 RepID=A0A9N7UD83_PLEPL|nr:unnamed protein product [Pleuronectes platessa]
MLDRPPRIHAHSLLSCLRLRLSQSSARSWQLSVLFTPSLSLSFFPLPARTHNPSAKEVKGKKNPPPSPPSPSTSVPSLMWTRLFLLVIHREAPGPVTVTLHRHITTQHNTGFKQPTPGA